MILLNLPEQATTSIVKNAAIRIIMKSDESLFIPKQVLKYRCKLATLDEVHLSLPLKHQCACAVKRCT